MTTPTGLAALAAADARSALSQCAALQVALGVDGAGDPVAAAAALIHIGDADDAIVAPYVVLIVKPTPPDFIADDLTLYGYTVEADLALAQDAGSTTGAHDMLFALNVDNVVGQLRALYDDHSSGLSFDLIAAGTSEAVRDDDTGAQGGVMMNLVVLNLECVDG